MRIIKYLISTKELSLQLSDKHSPEVLTAYSNANFAEDKTDRKSTTVFICKVFNGTVSWSSRKQNVVSVSTTEAEFYALAETIKEISWLKALLLDFNIKINEPICIDSVNQSCIKMVSNEKFSNKTKHIDVRYHYAHDMIRKNEISLRFCPTDRNAADMLTKPLAGTKIITMRELSNIL